MARRPNYGFEKRQKEMEKQRKKDAKAEKKEQRRRDAAGEEGAEGGEDAAPEDDSGE
jgi:hypothetical protein